MPDSYECKNKDFDYKKTSKELTEKFSRYPVSIKGIVLLIPEYLEGRTDSKTFAKNCNDRTPVLLTRVEMAKDGKEFSHTYQREISLVKSLNDMCFQYNKGIITKDNFDTFVEMHTQNLLKTGAPKSHRA